MPVLDGKGVLRELGTAAREREIIVQIIERRIRHFGLGCRHSF